MSNYQLMTEGFRILRASLAPFVARGLIRVYGDADWWRKGVWERLYDYQRRNIPEIGAFGELVDSLDVANCLLLVDINWRGLFGDELSRDCLSWVKELRSARNSWAHFGGKQPTSRDTWRTLDTMSRLCQEIDADAVAEVEGLIRRIAPGDLVMGGPEDDSAVDGRAGQTATIGGAQTEVSQGRPRRFMPKRDWTPEAFVKAVEAWCEVNGRIVLEGFDCLEFLDAAEAALAMPLLSAGEDNWFREAADNAIFQINGDKMRALTRPIVPDDAEGTSGEDGGEEAASGDADINTLGKDERGIPEQFEHLPRRKALWDREGILEAAYSWAHQHGRFLSDRVLRWRLDTVADMVLSKFPEQVGSSTAFADASPDTLFAPDSR